MASVIPRLAPGSVFAERFRVLADVGRGSTVSVYRAEPLGGGLPIALKLVELNGDDGRAARRLEREAESGRRIQSRYVARTLDVGKLGDDLGWLAMEYAPGPTLEELVRSRGGLDRGTSRLVLEQLFDAVAAAHAVGIVHRDLKPDSIRVSEQASEPHVVVLDFGLAEDLHLVATPWTAPEQTREGYQPAASADVWALGLLTFFALTGGIYWRHTSPTEPLADLALEPPRDELVSASQRADEQGSSRRLPAGFDAWFARAVSREASLRFADAKEAWEELALVLADASLVDGRASHRVSVSPGVFLTAVIVGVTTMGAAIYWLLRSMRI